MDGNHYPDGLTEAVIDALLEEVDRDLAAEEHTATVRLSREFTDQRRARRAERRANREALRLLADCSPLAGGLPGQGEAAATWAIGLDHERGEGEAA